MRVLRPRREVGVLFEGLRDFRVHALLVAVGLLLHELPMVLHVR